jgi:SAM-dependent methyltransferase
MKFEGVEIRCPSCFRDLEQRGSSLRCVSCYRCFPLVAGIPDLRVSPDPLLGFAEDRAKAESLVSHLGDMSFAELVDYYYSSSIVSPEQARRYKRGVLAAELRSKAALEAWEQLAPAGRAHSLLDVGCGTAPLPAAAAARFPQLVGVDIALRWLAIGKKRLADAGVNVPLICAGAEALPFPDACFDRLAMESALEVTSDPRRALLEAHRVLRVPGCLCIATPNRYSLGPDPHLGVWGGGLLRESWLIAYAKRIGAVPPRRQLFSPRRIARFVRDAGFARPRIQLPGIPRGQRQQFGKPTRIILALYEFFRHFPISRSVLLVFGPLLHVAAQKQDATRRGKGGSK